MSFFRHVCILTILSIFLSSAAMASCLDAISPDPHKLLFWSPKEQLCGYKHMEKLWPHANKVKASHSPLPLEQGPPLHLSTDAFMRSNHVAGLLILHNDKVVLEKYRNGFTSQDRWTSFSMAKSITSVLIGCALRDGSIKSLDDLVATYLPELAQGPYKKVTIRQLLTMTSGVVWNENYLDPKSDVAQLNKLAVSNNSKFINYMNNLPKKNIPGTKFNYSTGEANLIGLTLYKATKSSLSDYLSKKIWQPLGMEADAVWMANQDGIEVSGCCFSARMRDYGRFGLLMLHNGQIGSTTLFPDSWLKESTQASPASKAQSRPYGYQWWVRNNGSYQASGIFGQMIHIDPKRNLIIVMLSAWPKPIGTPAIQQERIQFVQSVKTAIDRLPHAKKR